MLEKYFLSNLGKTIPFHLYFKKESETQKSRHITYLLTVYNMEPKKTPSETETFTIWVSVKRKNFLDMRRLGCAKIKISSKEDNLSLVIGNIFEKMDPEYFEKNSDLIKDYEKEIKDIEL